MAFPKFTDKYVIQMTKDTYDSFGFGDNYKTSPDPRSGYLIYVLFQENQKDEAQQFFNFARQRSILVFRNWLD